MYVKNNITQESKIMKERNIVNYKNEAIFLCKQEVTYLK